MGGQAYPKNLDKEKKLTSISLSIFARFFICSKKLGGGGFPKNMKGGHWCPLHNHLSRKGSNLAHLCCSIVSNQGTLSLSVDMASILEQEKDIVYT